MLCLSIQDWDHNPYLRFEIEPYYPRQNRRVYSEQDLVSLDNHAILEDAEFLEELGFRTILRLLVVGKSRGQSWAQIIYPHQRRVNAVLRVDEEFYEYKPHRIFCADILSVTLEKDQVLKDKNLMTKIGKTILTYLPLQAEENALS